MTLVIPVDELYNTKCQSATVSTSQSEQNEIEALMERRSLRDGKKTVYLYQERIVSFCNITDKYRKKADDNDFQGNCMLCLIFSFMTMIMMIMTSCLGQWTCTLGKIFREGVERCSKRIRGWLAACCFIECYRISIVLFYETDNLPNFKFSEIVMQFM